MARNEITFLVNLRKDENSASRTYGMYFAEAERTEPLSLKGFARHLADHGKLASYEMLVLVLQNVVSCMKELICQGRSVKLDGLGIFYPTIENKKGGAESVGAFDVNTNIEGVHLRFLPEGAKGEELTSRELLKSCVFELHDLVKTRYKVIDGKKQAYQERTPLSTYAIA
ncbi:MAG: hypothetical protein IJR87_08620, partial [Bacteroidaceae bacterium]|nr:hypothetical protein [Bacteroidaceae bacterium]